MSEFLHTLGQLIVRAAHDAAPVALALFAVLLVFTLAREAVWAGEWIVDRVGRWLSGDEDDTSQ